MYDRKKIMKVKKIKFKTTWTGCPTGFSLAIISKSVDVFYNFINMPIRVKKAKQHVAWLVILYRKTIFKTKAK